MIRSITALLLPFVLGFVSPAQPTSEARLLRFPAIHGDQIVFTYAGDLYSVPASGGVARKLTNDVGVEIFARFSPDGQWLAFTGQYDGNTEVYVMPAGGGIPKRLTITATVERDDVSDRMGPNNIVMGWRDDRTILFRSRMIEPNSFKGQLFTVSIDGGLAEQLPLPRGGFASYAPDRKRLAYNQVFREFRTWKRYRGGQADDISIYDFDTKQTTKVASSPAQDIIPMWSGNRIYFLSDRDERQRMNLYSYDLTTRETRQLTTFTEFDVKFPSLGDHAIVFENGGYLYRYNLASGSVTKVTVQINADLVSGRGGLIDVSRSVTNFEISPDGSRALFGSRGDVFTVPAKHGPTRNLTRSPGVHERNSKWSPDGKWISFVSDATGEDEIYLQAQDGLTPAVRLTTGGDVYKYQPVWSPDSRKLLWSDRKQRLQYIDIESKAVTVVAQATAFEITQYDWSPDSRWIAFARPEEKQMTTIYLYALETKQTTPVTDGWFSSTSPSFSSDGQYLLFVSNRSLNPTYSQTEWNHAYSDMAKIYLLTLANDTKSPFAPKSDEVKPAVGEEKPKDDRKKDDAKNPMKVDLEGIQTRIAVLPISPAGYGNIQTVGEKVFYVRRGSKDDKPVLLMYDFAKEKETELGNVNGFEISADGKKMLVSTEGNAYAIIDLPSAKIDTKDRLNLSDLKVQLDRQAEWNQIFNETWRQMRDFFYDPGMHGVDWTAVRERYKVLVPFVSHRIDLTYVLGEMIGELNVGHAYVGGGDYPKPERIPLGLLGAKVSRDGVSGYYRIDRILKGQNWDRALRSPLTEIGVNVREGDYILAVDGVPTRSMTNLFDALIGKAGKQVTLTVNAQPKEPGSRSAVVVPTGDEQPLYYFDWVEGTIAKVSKATNGRVGYIHIPDMGVPGLNEFVKYYYPQLRKDALIIDVRGNGGGNVSPQIIERLRREAAMVGISRNATPSFDPGGTHVGPKVMLIDEFSASDGDIVAYRFKHYKMGPVVGKRSWGGVVGIRGSLPLLDGGSLNRPEFSRYDLEGKEWIMEGYGVEPDIIVENDPAKEFAGEDQQLNKGIDLALEALRLSPPKLAPPPPYPKR
jgi:tricorn protease